MKNNEGVEIYVHIPFCARKCAYCDFTSFVCNEDIRKNYFQALKKQIETVGSCKGRLPVVSCFFGGGTPSLPEASYITDTLNTLKETFDFYDDAEITIEINPNSASREKLLSYKEAGFNRLSIGLQSTDDWELSELTRLHDYKTFLETYKNARSVGFKNINVDLMSGIPGQTKESLSKTLERVCDLGPEHISAYSLIIEPGTPFFEKYGDAGSAVSEETDREMYAYTKEYLEKRGYFRYEISNYSKKGFECRHNLGYWRRIPYIGFGIAAASLMGSERTTTHGDLSRFINGDFSGESEPLDKNDIISEYMFLGLRCIEGVSKEAFFKEFGVTVEELYGKELKKLKDEGLILCDDRIRLSDKGLDLANYCMSFFLL